MQQRNRSSVSGAEMLGSLRNNELFPDTEIPSNDRKRALQSSESFLPELEESGNSVTPLWRRPAILVSAGMALVVLIVAAVLIIAQVNSQKPPAVSNLTATPGAANVDLRWDGPDVPYSVLLLKDNKIVADLTYLVRGREAWIPKTAALAPAGACYLIRPATVASTTAAPSTDTDLATQGAAKVCPKP